MIIAYVTVGNQIRLVKIAIYICVIHAVIPKVDTRPMKFNIAMNELKTLMHKQTDNVYETKIGVRQCSWITNPIVRHTKVHAMLHVRHVQGLPSTTALYV